MSSGQRQHANGSWVTSSCRPTRPITIAVPRRSAPAASGFGFNWPGVWGLSSYHSGGANVVMLDGSVRFLKNSTNIITVWCLGSIAQGEVISSDSY